MKIRRVLAVLGVVLAASLFFMGRGIIIAKDSDVIPKGITIDGHEDRKSVV